MASTLTPPPSGGPSAPPDLHVFKHHWQDEADASYLYKVLAGAEPDPRKKDIYARLADVEERHVEIWARLMSDYGSPPGKFQPSARARVLAKLGAIFGPGFLLPMLLSEEGREVKAYMDMHRSTAPGVAGKGEALTLARESAEHATTLAGIAGRGGEPWHRTASGGYLRNVVYGFNDGLTANFGLVAGVIGAGTITAIGAGEHHMVIVAGIAGLIADALSMGSSGYLAAKSEQEVYAHEIAMEKDEIALMPEVEREELALLYQAKGMDPEHANALAERLTADPARMLQEHVREELKIGEPDMSPFRQAWITGVATGIGAVIPVFPFLFIHSGAAVWAALVLAMLAHFGVGAARAVFTGRGVMRSGMDMFVVGLGVAVVGYFIGEWIGRTL